MFCCAANVSSSTPSARNKKLTGVKAKHMCTYSSGHPSSSCRRGSFAYVLIQPGHDDRDKDTAEELLEEVLRTMPIAKLEDPEMRLPTKHRRVIPPEIQSHLVLHLPDDHDQHCHETKGLQRICPDDRLDTAPERI